MSDTPSPTGADTGDVLGYDQGYKQGFRDGLRHQGCDLDVEALAAEMQRLSARAEDAEAIVAEIDEQHREWHTAGEVLCVYDGLNWPCATAQAVARLAAPSPDTITEDP